MIFIACNNNIQNENKIKSSDLDSTQLDKVLLKDSMKIEDSIIIDDPNEAMRS